MFIQRFKALIVGRVQHLKQIRQPLRKIAPVLCRALFDEVLKLPALENAGVLTEQAKQQPDKIDLQGVAFVTYDLELVMQPSHAFGGLDVYCVLFLERRGLIPGNEAEQPDVFIKLLEGEFMPGNPCLPPFGRSA